MRTGAAKARALFGRTTKRRNRTSQQDLLFFALQLLQFWRTAKHCNRCDRLHQRWDRCRHGQRVRREYIVPGLELADVNAEAIVRVDVHTHRQQ